jgi:predicted DNA-binding protein (UPF0251 family)
MSNVIWDALSIRRANKPQPARISANELEALRLQAQFNAETTNAASWRRLVIALEELEERRRAD